MFIWARTVAIAITLGALAHAAGAQALFKCGASFQDKPCATEEVQKRFSATSGGFSIDQVNPDTDKDCAGMAGELMPYWQRLQAGEGIESLRAQFDAKPVSRYDKSRLRDVLLSLKEYKGSAREVRSRLEAQCMNSKFQRGVPTEKDSERLRRMQDAQYGAQQAQMRRAQDYAEEQRLRNEEQRLLWEDQMHARAAQQSAARAAAAAAAAARAQERARDRQ
jgi:hypothetical protein